MRKFRSAPECSADISVPNIIITCLLRGGRIIIAKQKYVALSVHIAKPSTESQQSLRHDASTYWKSQAPVLMHLQDIYFRSRVAQKWVSFLIGKSGRTRGVGFFRDST